MAGLPNHRHERFAQAIAKGMSAYDAYIEAGYKPDRGAASRLSAKVSNRVSELLDCSAMRAELTVASATERLLALAAKGDSSDSPAGWNVSRAAIMDACKLNGLVIERAEIKAEVEHTDARERLTHLLAGQVAAAEAGERTGKPH